MWIGASIFSVTFRFFWLRVVRRFQNKAQSFLLLGHRFRDPKLDGRLGRLGRTLLDLVAASQKMGTPRLRWMPRLRLMPQLRSMPFPASRMRAPSSVSQSREPSCPKARSVDARPPPPNPRPVRLELPRKSSLRPPAKQPPSAMPRLSVCGMAPNVCSVCSRTPRTRNCVSLDGMNCNRHSQLVSCGNGSWC